MEVFKSKNGIFYKVLEWAECPKHGRYVSRIAEWRGKNEFGSPWSCVCQACRDEAEAKRMFSQAAIPPRFQGKTIESFQAGTEKAAEVKQFFADYAANLPECIRDGRSVILTGRCGTGKTHLACALALDAKAMGFTALFTSVAKIVRNIRESWGSASGASERQIIDRVPTDQLIIDPMICDFSDYPQADWMCQCVPMSREYVEDTYKIKVDGAAVYTESAGEALDRKELAPTGSATDNVRPDDQVMVFEIWDRRSQRVYTMCDGCQYFLREPDSPQKVGSRWFPFFLLPFDQVVDTFVAPSLVDLMEGLQEEHNKTRDTQMLHKDFCKPGYIASADVDEKSITRFAQAELGEITILKNTEGQDLRSLIQPKQYPPLDQALYDTTAIRQDIEQVTGMQDAMRSTVVQPKTATEAQIMQQGLSGRVAAFRDAVEDFLQEVAFYSAQVLLQELDVKDVEDIMGKAQPDFDPVTLQIVPVEQPFVWYQLSATELSRLIRLKIEAGSTGAPNKLQEQENWGKVVPTIMQAVQALYQLGSQGLDTTPFETVISETCRRFDERIDPKAFIPDLQPQLAQQAALQQAAAQAQGQGAVQPAAAQPSLIQPT